jgi:cation diffusion facilitator family transporter
MTTDQHHEGHTTHSDGLPVTHEQSHADDHGHDEHHGYEDDYHRHRHGLIDAIASRVLHGHHHEGIDPATDAAASNDEGMRALWYSLVALAVTSAVQLLIVFVSHSVALLADSIHNFADALTAIPLAIAFWLGRKAANRRYTYGYGRAEDLAGVTIVAAIAASSVLAGWEAIDRLIRPSSVHEVGWVIAAGMVGFVGKELVARYRIRVGRKIGSAALVADGLHARTDGFTSLAVAAGGVAVAAGWKLADPIVGLLITVAIALILKDAALEIFRRLMDSVDPKLVEQIEAVLSGVPGVEAVDSVRVRWVGRQLFAEVSLVSDRALSLGAAHQIAETAQHTLLHEVPRLADVTIHSNPCGHDGEETHSLLAHHRRFGQSTPP